MSPRPTASRLRGLYNEAYFESGDPACGYPVYRTDRAAVRDKAERLLPAVERHAHKGRLLDLGCAYGFVMEVAREHGWEVAGIEPAEEVAASVARTLGVPVARDLESAGLAAGTFDAVLLWDVIEHLPDPRRTVDELARLLRPGGILSVVTPDVGSLAARLLGRHWEEMRKLPEHIYFFNRKSLVTLLRVAGFEPVEWGTVGKRMTLEETLSRLLPAFPRLGRAVLTLARASGLHRLVAYFDPRWKLAVTARLTRSAGTAGS
jgi:SAM-dependent methyltransferase